MLTEFILYLESQITEPYVWGGQHTKLTPQNYVSVITKMEKDATNRKNAIAYCEKMFQVGKTELFAYDCSGLGMYWLYNVKRIFDHDMTADSMMRKCEIVHEAKRGYWVFRTDSNGKATHIGYMVSDTELVEAKGRKYGVVRTKYNPSAWNKIGKPKCFNFDPEPTLEPTAWYVKVLGGSVHVRKGPSVLYCSLGTAHRGDRLPYLGTDEKTGWYKVKYNGQDGYITNKPKYTEVVEVVL